MLFYLYYMSLVGEINLEKQNWQNNTLVRITLVSLYNSNIGSKIFSVLTESANLILPYKLL